ncbi:DUF6470 family protein [Robertmurraya korlensis]|uniref:DUF6470 family protein n=1 Tax=Robertmurraya korlensis TaxID=519977 RepID=UPI0020410D42|nr:DUF6470 family protein [Robertmurraya korlensis]MCM3602653.1 DUF6470 family protein [Robertmurraya korlensis]
MRIPQIRIQTTPAQIEITTQKGQMLIEQPPGELQIEQPQATVNITRIPGKLTIDQTQARADVDLKSIRKRIEEAAQMGKQDLLAGIARRAQEGEELMKIENGFGAISSISRRSSDGPKKEFNIGWIPRAGSVKIEYDPGKLEVDAKSNKPIINYVMNKPNLTYTPSEVIVGLRQYADIKIDFE